MAIRCIALDYSGTLAFPSKSLTIEDVINVWHQMGEKISESMIADLSTLFNASVLKYSCFGGVHAWDELLEPLTAKYSLGVKYDEFSERLWASSPDSQMHDSAVQVVRALREKGYRLFLASNTRRPASSRLRALKQSNALDFFERTFISSTLGFGKPDPEFYKLIVQAGNCLPRELLFVGDSLVRDVIEPVKHGMNAVWLNGRKRPGRAPKDIPEIDDVSQLPALLEKNQWQ
ncbi:HAD family hydrolase (plasmid) [Agrobacterium sp. rho-8.1]|nr:HAD family hydrolase [Agrobacterium sp. rho-8.1]